MTTSLRSTGTAIPIMLGLALLCWLVMLRGFVTLMSKAPEPGGNNEARLIQQGWAAAGIVVIWLLLAGVMLVMSVKETIPVSVGFASWLLHPVTCVLALGAIAAMYDAGNRWMIAVPAGAPLLIAGYLVYVLYREASPTLGFALWVAVLALSLPILPTGIRYTLEKMGPRGGSVPAEPGPELDRFKASELARRHAQELEDLQREMDRDEEDQRLYGYQRLSHPASTVRNEALAAMRKIATRQQQAEDGFMQGDDWLLRVLPDIDVKPTPRLCKAARAYIQSQIDWVKKDSLDSPTNMLRDGIDGIGWLAANCDFKAELDQLDEMTRTFADTPENREFREKLASFRKPKTP